MARPPRGVGETGLSARQSGRSGGQNGGVSSDLERRRRFEAVADEVYEPLQRYLRRRASYADAEEVFGDTLLTVWRRIEDVPPAAALPWCYGVARRALANKRRSASRHLRLVQRAASVADPPPPDPAVAAEHPEVTAAVASLPESDREVLHLWAWEELEPREIAVVLGTTANAVSLRLTRAKAKLAREIERQSAPDRGHEPGASTEEHRP